MTALLFLGAICGNAMVAYACWRLSWSRFMLMTLGSILMGLGYLLIGMRIG